MIIRNVVAKKDMVLNTKIHSVVLEAGVPMLVRFSSEQELNALLTTGNFVVSDAPPPKVIEAPIKVIPPVKEKPLVLDDKSKVDKKPLVSDDQSDVPVLDDDQDSNPVPDENKCTCGNTMIPVVDETRPGVDILYCNICSIEVVVGEISKPKNAGDISKRVFSKCSICGKRKAADAQYCKKCNTTPKI